MPAKVTTDLDFGSASRIQNLPSPVSAGEPAIIDGSGKIPVALIPATVINDTFTVASEAAMLALSAAQGDLARRTDVNKTFSLSAEPATTLGNWLELLQAPDPTKADLASPTFTGTPTLPTGTIAVTQSPGNNTTAIATTAFVTAALTLTPTYI